MIIIYKLYHDWAIEKAEINKGSKMLNGRRLSSMQWREYFPEQAPILDPRIEEHNRQIRIAEEAADRAQELENSIFNS